MKKLSDLDELLDLDEEDVFDETEDAFEEDVFDEPVNANAYIFF